MDFKQAQLDNGLTIVGEVNPAAQSVAVGFFVRTGARDETPAISGVSHFLEHMLFKGTERLSALEVNEAFDRTGAKFNAFTGEESTVYYAAVLPEHLAEVTDLWAQLMRPALRDDDFDMEKNVILEEIAMYRDLPQFDVMDRCRAMHFGGHPCGHSVLGTEESIGALTAEQMRQYFHRRYAPNNLVLACCGRFDFDALVEQTAARCGAWGMSEAGRELSFYEGTRRKESQARGNLSRAHVCLISPAPSVQDERRFAASLLGVVAGDETGSRLFWALVDTARAETAGMQYEGMDGVGAFYTYIRAGAHDLDGVLDTVDGVLGELAREGVQEKELEAAKNKVLSALAIKSETPMGRLVDLGLNWQYLQTYRSVAEDVGAVKAVTVEQVNALLETYPLDQYTRLVLKPGQQGAAEGGPRSECWPMNGGTYGRREHGTSD